MKESLLNIPALTRQGAIASFDETSRTAVMNFSTGAQVHRFDFFFGEFFEEVSLEEQAADLSRVREGAVPFLRDHGSDFFRGPVISDVLGRITDADVNGERGKATVLFSRRPENLGIIQDIKDGVLRSVSMGYLVREMEKVGERGGVPILRATDWQLFEISSVAMPADAGASFRSLMQNFEGLSGRKLDAAKDQVAGIPVPRLFPCKLRGFSDAEIEAMHKRFEAFKNIFGKMAGDDLSSKKEHSESHQPQIRVETSQALPEDQMTGDIQMTEAEKKALEERKLADEAAKRDAELVKAKEAAKAEGAEEAVKLERARVSSIRKAVAAAKLDSKFEEKMINDGINADQARELVIEELAKRDEKPEVQTRQHPRIEAGDLDEVDTRRQGMKEAILHRGFAGDPEKAKNYPVTERAREWAGLSLMEMARESLRRQGVSTGHMSRVQLAVRAMHSTSDFPEITGDIINKSLRDAYAAAPQTFAPFTRRVQNPDFKTISRTQLGHGSELEKVPQGGEIKSTTMSESAEKYQIEEYAKMLSITRKTLINDDLDAFTRIPSSMGVKARSLESKLAWGVVTANAALADGNALFSAAHGNLTTGPGAAPSITELNKARSALRAQKDLDGEPLNLETRWLIVPLELETVGEQLVSQIQPDTASNVNPFGPSGRTPLSLIVEPRLSDDSAVKWYSSSSLDQVDMLELAFLTGAMEPEVLSEEVFDTLGMKFRVVHSVGAKAIDFRGLYRNDGA